MTRATLFLLLCFGVGLSSTSGQTTPDKSATRKTLDLAANPKLLTTHFSRYGFQPLKTIQKDWGGVRIQLPETGRKMEQTGIYSYFAMAGDFEAIAGFEILDLPEPGPGYGASVGIGVDSDPPDNIKLSLHRGNFPKRGNGFWVTIAKENGDKKEIDSQFFPGNGESGKLTLKREKDVVICLVADDYKKQEKELVRIPFTSRPIRVVRAFADNGGTQAEMEARIVGIKLAANQVTGGIPEVEGTDYGWLIWLLGTLAIFGLGYLLWKKSFRGEK
jgi:hypothetical protein